MYPLFTPNSLYHHYVIRHAKHIRRFNDLVERTPYDTQPLVDVLLETSHFPEAAPIFNQAAEVCSITSKTCQRFSLACSLSSLLMY